MKRTLLLFLTSLLCFGSAVGQQAKYVVLISIDGLRPDFYLDKSWPAPNLHQLMEEGVYSEGVRGIFPTVTYPSHTTIITGALPAAHGIYYNIPFEPQGATGNWFTEEKLIQTETLWDKVNKAGMKTASVSWPVSVGAPIHYNLPENFSLQSPGDRRAPISEAATPKGLFEEVMQNATGALEANDLNLRYYSMDENIGRMAGYIIRRYKPNFISVHIVGVDGAQHAEGREGKNVPRAVANADHAVGAIREAVEKAGILDSTAFVIVGDHGFVDIHTSLSPNVWLAQQGLISKVGIEVKWKAMFHTATGSAFLHLKDKNDKKTLKQVRDLLNNLPEEERKLFRIVEKEELERIGAAPDAVMALAAVKGVALKRDVDGPARKEGKGGAHGFYPDFPEIQTGFIASGAGVNKVKQTLPVGLEDIAPFVAELLGINFKPPVGVSQKDKNN
ncbi:alkaline phosphatase family protein [Pontibacter qinzhouensis]|uniref:Alkaline phosphatase family protein n=1 Tax=Pontibacter qinzhouensis TaxID=2603253 RepID=A0A5C8K7V8_9BACT|nr:ectonucleotide pyrophosphatase/phosphodiesterase [Pontibacter qinzhouensis]TXK45715.1 alkaline phosphatase family protein [Pontibacter qinzhouensis]